MTIWDIGDNLELEGAEAQAAYERSPQGAADRMAAKIAEDERIYGKGARTFGKGNIMYSDGTPTYWGHGDPANNALATIESSYEPRFDYNVPTTDEEKLALLKATDADGYNNYVKDPLSRGMAAIYPTTWAVRAGQALGIVPEWDTMAAMRGYISQRDEEELRREAYARANGIDIDSIWSHDTKAPRVPYGEEVRVPPLAIPNRYRTLRKD